MRRVRFGGLCLLIWVSACGDPGGLAYAEDEVPTTLIAQPSVTFDLAEQDLVIFHAAWLCEFQRRTFATPGGGEKALEEQLRRSEIDGAEYEGFLSRLSSSQNRRDLVLFEYQETCLR